MGRWMIATMAAAAALVLGQTPAAWASNIDTTGSDIGTVVPFGYANTATYGQTFRAGGSTLDSFTLYLRDRYDGSGTLDLRGYIGKWNGSEASSILYESDTRTMNAAGTLQAFDFSPSLALVSGAQYIAFLSVSNLPAQNQSTFGMPFGVDSIPGAFVYLNNGTDPSQWTSTPWEKGIIDQDDVAFKADFGVSAVPLPAALPEFALAVLALAGLGWIFRRPSAPDALPSMGC